ncbi:MAG: FtsX-like permease family protein [Anaerolineae bacterium]
MSWLLRFGLLRLWAQWRSLVILIIGVLLAAFIGANASLYTTAIAQAGMVQFLDAQPSAETNIFARVSLTPSDVTDLPAIWDTFDNTIISATDATAGALSSWIGAVIPFAETQALIPMLDGADIDNTRVRLAYYDNLSNHIELIDGTLPQEVTDPNIQAEVLLNAEAAVLIGVEVGDILTLDQRGRDSSQVFNVRVSGLIRPITATNAYWFEPSPLRFETAGNDIETNLLTSRADMAQIVAQFIPDVTIQIGWRIAPDFSQLPFTRVNSAITTVDDLTINLNEHVLTEMDAGGSYVFSTNLPDLLRQYREQIVFLNIPFGLFLLQLAALVLFFLILISALVRRGERREIAVLQSRGATDQQIIIARSVESALICLIATLIAPFLAQGLLRWFVPILTGIEQIPLELNGTVFGYAGFASAVAFIALTVTLLPVLRQPLITAGGAGTRSGTQTWWQKYYLDVILLIVGVIALYQLTESQSVVANTVTDNTQIDPLLIVAPTLLFVAFSSVLLRFFPWVMRVFTALFARQQGLEAVLAGWRVSREPLHYGRITFLLALAIGIGWFAVNYQATLIGNQTDQAQYRVGSDVRIVYEDPQSITVSESMARIASLPDVRASAEVIRYELPSVITVSGGGRRTRQAGDLLAFNPGDLDNVVEWRTELGTLNLPDRLFDPDQTIGVTVPADTQTIQFWAQLTTDVNMLFNNFTDDVRPNPLALLRSQTLRLRVQDATGRSIVLTPQADRTLIDQRIDEISADFGEGQSPWMAIDTNDDGQPDTVPRYDWPNDGWVLFEVDLTTLDAPLQLFAIDVFLLNDNQFSRAELTIGTLQFIGSEDTIALDYEAQGYTVQASLNAFSPQNLTTITPDDSRFGAEALYAEWTTATNSSAPPTIFSVMMNYPEYTSVLINTGNQERPAEEEATITGLPVLISRSFAELNEIGTLDQRFNLVINNVSPWFSVERVLDYYPTLYQERPYIVTDANMLNYTMQRATGSRLMPNELWLRLAPNVDQTAFIEQLRLSNDAPLFADILSFDAVHTSYQTDVLSVGVIGLLFISFMIGLALSIVSLMTYMSLTVQARIGEFAVLRALGMTISRMIFSILIEQMLVLFAAIVLGAIIGHFLTVQVLPPLALSAAGGVVTTPFAVIVDSLVIAQYLLIIFIMLMVVLALSAISVRRLATADALRLTEE